MSKTILRLKSVLLFILLALALAWRLIIDTPKAIKALFVVYLDTFDDFWRVWTQNYRSFKAGKWTK